MPMLKTMNMIVMLESTGLPISSLIAPPSPAGLRSSAAARGWRGQAHAGKGEGKEKI